ncbi:hypothetical protein [Arthrobacter glacialis]|uniref:hypothetical protein n=1 Tax=Arthrobacter glacialis TaxID=1664 RepID=UPI000CD48E2E|nr:hypothetical protein [Arthrobacter glacialis]POH59311.1 hypothetical protein CVS28_07500 [Arthrobacter glacialis]
MGEQGNSTGGRGPAPVPASRQPVSDKVYRRRRQVAGVLVLLIIAGLIAGGIFISGLLSSGSAPTSNAEPASTSSAKAKPAVKPGTPPAAVCDEAGIKVTATVDKPAYGPEEFPVLTLRVTNSGKSPCDINVGTSQMEFQITSGEDVIFNSMHCQLDATDLVKNLAPGASETANFVWKVKRSAPGCAKVAVEPGRSGGTYAFVAKLGKWSSEPVTFTLQ